MSFNNHRFTDRGKATTKRIGIRSIYDIINKNATDDWKINYIRHRYVYYEGNYDLFHDENGNPTETKALLDDIIEGVIKGTVDPSELSNINKEILKLRKQKNEEEELRKQKELDIYIQQQKEEETISNTINTSSELASYKKGISNAGVYFDLIDRYLDTLSPEERKKAETWSYKDLKKVAKWWQKNNNLKLPSKSPTETHEQSKAMKALLAGYKKYAEKEWKNKPEEN